MRPTDARHRASPVFVTRRRRSRHRLAPLLAHLRGPWLNRQLAAGVEPWRSPVHAARARQLTADRTRRMLARGLEQLVEQAEEPPSLSRAAVIHPWRPGVREARPLMLTLASRLRGSAPVDARGVAALKDLLTDGGGPVYSPGDPNTVKRQLEVIDQWLDVQD
jgi:hypothetical protein